MEAILQSGGETVMEFQVAAGSHVYIRTEDGTEVFKEWEEMTEEERESLKCAAEELEATINAYVSASAIVAKSGLL